jgi:hypothetical protein
MRKWRFKCSSHACAAQTTDDPTRVDLDEHAAGGNWHHPAAGQLPRRTAKTCAPHDARGAFGRAAPGRPCQEAWHSPEKADVPGRSGGGVGLRRGPQESVNFDVWHEELSERLDSAMKRLSPMLSVADPQ